MLKLFDGITKSYPDILNIYVGLKDKRMYMKPDGELPDGLRYFCKLDGNQERDH